MKTMAFISMSLFIGYALVAQSYPEPEFGNEVYFLKKEDPVSVQRLEKGSSKLEYKSKVGGLGGAENGYVLEGEKSPVRLSAGTALSFVFSTGSPDAPSAVNDSVMRANGMDPAMMSGMGSLNDPTTMITLYNAGPGNGLRKIYMMKMKGAFSLGSKKIQSSDKYTFGVKKIRPGYWELVLDKTLPKGEYAFSMTGGNYDGSTTLFAFGVD